MKKIFSLFAAVLFAGSMMAESITITAESGFKSAYGDGTFTVSEVEFAYSGVMYNAKKNPAGFGSKQLMQFRKSSSSTNPGEIGNKTEMNLKSIIVATQNDKAFTLSAGTAADALEEVADPAKSTDTYAYKDPDGKDASTSVTTYTFDVEGMKYFDMKNGTAASYIAYIIIELGSGEAPAVAKPAIAGDANFFDQTEVSITCETEGAKIYYTVDGSEPTAASIAYTEAFPVKESMTIKAIAIKGEDKSNIATKEFVKNPSFASIEDLVDADLASGSLMRVSFKGVLIDTIYTTKQEKRYGIFLNVMDATGANNVEIFYNKNEVPEAWVKGGAVSGAIIGTWTLYNSTWEIIPSGDDWVWTSLIYKAPGATAISNTAAEVKAVKFFENGQLFIRKGDKVFDATGAIIK